jgi:glutamate-ammonia-ligase adenylyltransferase
LARYLARNSQVFDGVIGGTFFADWPGADALAERLSSQLAAEEHYEARLDTARRWQKEWHFRIGVHHLRGLIDPAEAARQYTDLADAILRALWPVVQENFAIRHGAAPGRGAVILGMGSLGASRLNARSDLDLIVIYDPKDVEASDGRRPLPARTYYARLTQALVTALSAPTAEGRLFEVDMRLRPSGNQGPVATSWSAFQLYQQTEAWTWEHMALTSARPVAGPEGLSQDVAAFRETLLSEPRDGAATLREVADMRGRIATAKGDADFWDMKVGRGRMQDVELLSQAATLAAGRPSSQVSDGVANALSLGWVSEPEAKALAQAWTRQWSVNMTTKLLTDQPPKPETLGAGGCALLLRDSGAEDIAALKQTLEQERSAAADILDALLKDASDG